MVKGISAVDAICSSAKNTAQKVSQKVKDNEVEILSGGALAAGVGLYGTALYHYVNSDTVELSASANPNVEVKQGFLQKISEKIKDKFSIDLNNPPAGIDPTEPYMMNKAGHYIMDEYGAIPNPWYNPDLVEQAIPSAVESLSATSVSMDSFLHHAAANADATGILAASFGDNIDIPDDVVDENFIQVIGNSLKKILELVAENM